MSHIRKISVGQNYKVDAMHYVVGQPILKGSHTIDAILKVEDENVFEIWIRNSKGESVIWKAFRDMPISVEYNIDY